MLESGRNTASGEWQYSPLAVFFAGAMMLSIGKVFVIVAVSEVSPEPGAESPVGV
jgi:hypothetical protein